MEIKDQLGIVARVISEICAPWILNGVFFLILGGTSEAWLPGIVAVLGTSLRPMLLIIGLMKMGKVGNHHVTARSQRAVVFAGIIVCVVVLIAVLSALPAPEIIWAGVFSALVFLVLFALVTTKIKASVHVGLWVCLVLFLGIGVSAWFFIGLFFTPVTAWARVQIRHHSLPEIYAGVVSGAVATLLSFVLFLN